MDHSATTPVAAEVFEAMRPHFCGDSAGSPGDSSTFGYGNPSSVHACGRAARQAVERAREQVAALISARPTEIVFTSGGTESDNLALKGTVELLAGKGKHLITCAIEHHAILHTCQALEKRGFEVTILGVDRDGLIDLDELRAAIRPETILISIMHANNEVGTVQNIAEISVIARERGVVLHTDAVQSAGHVSISVDELGVDLLSLSAHKLYGPKGVGALYVRRGKRLTCLLDGGGQEKNRRSGTENVAGIVGLGTACELAQRDFAGGEMQRLARLRERLIAGVLARVPDSVITGHPSQRLPGLASFCFRGVDGEGIVLGMDDRGVCVSTGSACSSGSLDPSHVLLALGYEWTVARGSCRFSLGRDNDEREVDEAVAAIADTVSSLRALAPAIARIED